MKEIGLIGYGNFGKFLASHLSQYFIINVYDINLNNKEDNNNIIFSDLNSCLKKEIIILSIPVQYLEKFLIDHSRLFNQDAFVFDVSSVKMKPVMLMEKYLSGNTQIIGTHPLFGPQSAVNGIKGFKIVLCPGHTAKSDKVIKFLSEKLGLNVIIKSPEDHDMEMAFVQGLTHFIAKAMHDIKIPDLSLKTPTFEKLYAMYEILKNDTPELFYTIENENPFSKDVRRLFVDKLKEIDNKLGN
jgi:prephenate dehydrogenase